MLKLTALGLFFLGMCVGCAERSNSKPIKQQPLVVATANIPPVGSEDWFVWVEKSVATGDGQGHGPDYGSQEWCFVIEKKLFANKSGVTPCTNEWNQKVTDTLLKSNQ